MLKPLSDHIVIEPLKEEKKKSTIILPDSVEKKRQEQGKVIAVGAGKLDANGKRVPLEVKKGDIVIFAKYGPNEVKIDGKDYVIAREDDILAIIG